MQKRRTRKAFTLIELLAVLTILAILAAVMVPAVFNQLEKGKIKAAKALMGGIEQSLNAYNLDCGSFPTTEQGLEALINPPTTGDACKNYDSNGYYSKKKIPDDPWNRAFVYHSPGQINPGSYDLSSKGKDGQEGTEDDVKSWEP